MLELRPEWAIWAQVVGTAVQIIVLGVLIWQVWVNRQQAKVAEKTLIFARDQHRASLGQIAQDRIDAVRPALAVIVLKTGQGTYIDGEDKEHPVETVTYQLENFGRGSAANISVSAWLDHQNQDQDRPVDQKRLQGIGVGRQDTISLWFYSAGSGELVVTYEDIYKNRYEHRFGLGWVSDPEGELHHYIDDLPLS